MIDFNDIQDEDLYGMCINGDDEAWRYMYNYILTICSWGKWNIRVEAEELAQEITLHLVENAIKKCNERNKFRNFVKVMTINKIKDSFKSPVPGSIDEPVKNGKGEEKFHEATRLIKSADRMDKNVAIEAFKSAFNLLNESKECFKKVREIDPDHAIAFEKVKEIRGIILEIEGIIGILEKESIAPPIKLSSGCLSFKNIGRKIYIFKG